jgi:hypothetical protein
MTRRALAPLLLVVAAAAVSSAEGERSAPPVPEVGKAAPAFRLNDHEGRVVAIGPGASKTWVVLAFYPKALTGG